jgi:hypothetical protein
MKNICSKENIIILDNNEITQVNGRAGCLCFCERATYIGHYPSAELCNMMCTVFHDKMRKCAPPGEKLAKAFRQIEEDEARAKNRPL